MVSPIELLRLSQLYNPSIVYKSYDSIFLNRASLSNLLSQPTWQAEQVLHHGRLPLYDNGHTLGLAVTQPFWQPSDNSHTLYVVSPLTWTRLWLDLYQNNASALEALALLGIRDNASDLHGYHDDDGLTIYSRVHGQLNYVDNCSTAYAQKLNKL